MGDPFMELKLERSLWQCARMGALLLLVSVLNGCGPSEWEREFDAMMEASKKQTTAAAVSTAVLPLFSKYSERSIPTKEIPKEILALPLFAGEPKNIEVSPLVENSNILLFTTGSGFGHWGIAVCRHENDQQISEWHRRRLVPWVKGCSFTVNSWMNTRGFLKGSIRADVETCQLARTAPFTTLLFGIGG